MTQSLSFKNYVELGSVCTVVVPTLGRQRPEDEELVEASTIGQARQGYMRLSLKAKVKPQKWMHLPFPADQNLSVFP